MRLHLPVSHLPGCWASLLSFAPLAWIHDQRKSRQLMSNTEHNRCQRRILVSPAPNPAFRSWLAPWINAMWNWEAGKQQSESDEFWFPAICQGAHSALSPLQKSLPGLEVSPVTSRGPAVAGEVAWSPLSAAILLRQVSVQFGRCWAQLCTANQLPRQFTWITAG